MALTLVDIERLLKNLDRRTQRIEQILPTLATKEEMQATVRAAIAPLATKEELKQAVREEGERTRLHFDIVAESLRDNIKIIAEGHLSLDARVTRLERRS